jgi:hypothetical protein
MGERAWDAPDVEVAETHAAGWAWRCHVCDVTQVNLTEIEAKTRATRHQHWRQP